MVSVLVLSACSPDKVEEDLKTVSNTMYEGDTQVEDVWECTKNIKNYDVAETLGDDNHKLESDSFVSVDMDTKKIVIPQGHITSIYKDIYYGSEKKYDNEVNCTICEDINNSEIVQISIDYQEIIKKGGLGEYLQYPIVLETGCEEEYAAIGLLAQDGTDYYVQLNLTILANNLENADSYNLNQPADNKRYINCFVRSEKLYHDIINFWGKRVTVRDIQNPERVEIFIQTGQGSRQTVCFTEQDAEKFTRGLLTESYAVYDEHSFGIAMTISISEENHVKLYYADDGCSMFQLDGVSYNLKPEGEAVAVMKKYIEKLEEKTDEIKCQQSYI